MEVGSIYWPDWGTLAVAVIALLQPWAGAAYRKWFRTPSVSIFPTGRVEVGYSQFGPTIGLHGALKVDQEDAFVREIELEVVRERDQATHTFYWQLFRQERGRLSELQDFEVELAAGFMLSVNKPHRYSILFSDVEVQEQIKSALETLKRSWSEFVLERFSDLEQLDQETALDLYNRTKRTLYEEFRQRENHLDAWRVIDRARYWEAGDYALTMRVHTADPQQTFEESWSFSLDEDQEEILSLNVPRILQAACDQDAAFVGNFSFAYSDYEEVGPRLIRGT